MLCDLILYLGILSVLFLPCVLMAAWTENTRTGARFMDWVCHKMRLEEYVDE